MSTASLVSSMIAASIVGFVIGCVLTAFVASSTPIILKYWEDYRKARDSRIKVLVMLKRLKGLTDIIAKPKDR